MELDEIDMEERQRIKLPYLPMSDTEIYVENTRASHLMRLH